MKWHDVIQFFIALIPLAGVIWHVAEIKAQIFKYIDTAINSIDDRVDTNDKKFEVFVTRFEERKEFVDYQIHAANEKINHKFQRLMDEVKQLKKD